VTSSPSVPAFAPDGAWRSVGLAANLTLRIASAFIRVLRCRSGPMNRASPRPVLCAAGRHFPNPATAC